MVDAVINLCTSFIIQVWVFRQAGRHLPEYNAYKLERNKNFLEMLQNPNDVAEVTMQPIRRYNLDAAILFSDILVVLQALGFEVAMPGGLGITVPNPITTVEDFHERMPKGRIDIHEKLPHVIQSVKLIKQQLQDNIPLIGFSGAPWTLMFYLLGGTSKKNKSIGSDWLQQHPAESTLLLERLTTVVIDYLSAQIDAGADIIQVFEAMGDFINPEHFHTFALPCLARIASELKRKYPEIPLMVFPKGASYSLEALQTAGYDVVTLDTQVDRSTIRSRLQAEWTRQQELTKQVGHNGIHSTEQECDSLDKTSGACIQGNFDVKLLRKGTADRPGLSVADIQHATKDMLCALGPQRLIANLGEGLTGTEDPVLVAAFIDAVHSMSAEMIAEI